MFIFRGGANQTQNAQDANAAAATMQEWTNWMNGLGQQNVLVGGEPLKPTGKQVTGRKMVITDGPFVEAKESVGGYLIVNARDINHAVELSKGCPIFDADGKLEVRPVQAM